MGREQLRGAAYVVYGSATAGAVDLAYLGSAGLTISGGAANDYAGAAYVVDGFTAGPVAARAPALSGLATAGRVIAGDLGVWQNP